MYAPYLHARRRFLQHLAHADFCAICYKVWQGLCQKHEMPRMSHFNAMQELIQVCFMSARSTRL